MQQVPGILAALSGLALVFSVLHEYGYFYIVGPELLSLLGAVDFLRLAINWLPLSVLSGAVGVLPWMFKSSNPSKEFEKLDRTFARIAKVIALAFFLFAAAATLVRYEPTGALYVYSAIHLIVVPRIALNFEWYRVLPESQKITAVVAPLLLVMAFLSGQSDAFRDLRRTSPAYVLESSSGPPLLVTVLRVIDRGVLVKTAENRLRLMQWSDVKSLQRVLPARSEDSPLTVLRKFLFEPEETPPMP